MFTVISLNAQMLARLPAATSPISYSLSFALLFRCLYFSSSLFHTLTHTQNSGNSTTASVHPVTVDESDSGPTATNYDAYQYLHTHQSTHSRTYTHSTDTTHTMYTHSMDMQSKSKAHICLYYIRKHISEVMLQRND